MEKIQHLKIIDCEESLYLRPARMVFEQDGREKTWDLLKVHDSVGAVIFNISRQVLVFVRQFRPAVYYSMVPFEDVEYGKDIDTRKYPTSLGFTIELCAGIVDKDQSLAEIMKDEILEECGYSVPLEAIQKITSYRSGVGVAGSLQTVYYAEVTDSMKVSDGGGNRHEGEYIELVELDLPQAKALIYDETVPRPLALVFALTWFFNNKLKISQKL
ncbi:hypothetical protein JTE90_016227 [Oedothorax gibbosus]|uniref:Uridine diphosphate glucose pyrophosphatase NUDT14 n=1 Tax=Oedothorax gibbosus TaxID=931172 RepID=A0AAV6VRG7_9ARAC|nr:hypothetical protein JTE90_016227 [Oedothorax gibbosus]